MKERNKILGLSLFALFIFFLLPHFGAEQISPMALWKSSGPYELEHRILWSLRIPRLLVVITAGGSLAMLGATYQNIFNNVLAEPYILGISSAVTLGIVVGEVFLNLTTSSPQSFVLGLIFSLIVILVLIASYHWRPRKQLERIVLFGMGLNFIFSSLLFLILSYRSQTMGAGSMRWLFGNIPWTSLGHALIFVFINSIFILVLWIMGRFIDALTLGDSIARTMGFSPNQIRGVLLFLTSLQLTLITSMTGAIGFLGLVAPHCIRLAFRPPSSRWLLSGSFVAGALFLGISDSLSRIILPPLEFPIGVITTLLGGPLFLYLLWKK